MKIKILMQALRFACLPTLSVLLLLFFGFFNITKTIDFISSDNGWAIAIRVILFIAEIALIATMYEHYNKEYIKEKALEGKPDARTGETMSYHTNLEDIWGYNQGNREAKYIKYPTENKNIILIEKILKS